MTVVVYLDFMFHPNPAIEVAQYVYLLIKLQFKI